MLSKPIAVREEQGPGQDEGGDHIEHKNSGRHFETFLLFWKTKLSSFSRFRTWVEQNYNNDQK